MRVFTVAEAKAMIPEVRERAEVIIRLRANLAELSLALRTGDGGQTGGVPEVKALEAHLGEAIGWFNGHGIEVKGIAPLLVDFPSVLDGEDVRLCWLEGDETLGWYHRTELGFAGRRRLA